MTHTDSVFEQAKKATKFPLPPAKEQGDEMEVYARFMRHLRYVPNSRSDVKVLSAIQFTADMMDYSDAHVAKNLVDMGLRAPRMAFPAEFLSYADQALMRSKFDVGGPSDGLLELREFWNACGEDKFAAIKREYPLLEETAVV